MHIYLMCGYVDCNMQYKNKNVYMPIQTVDIFLTEIIQLKQLLWDYMFNSH